MVRGAGPGGDGMNAMTRTDSCADLACSDLDRSADFFADIFGRGPDSRPAPGEAVWIFGEAAGFRLVVDGTRAGQGVLTLSLSGIATDRERVELGAVGPSSMRLRDPDGNEVLLTAA